MAEEWRKKIQRLYDYEKLEREVRQEGWLHMKALAGMTYNSTLENIGREVFFPIQEITYQFADKDYRELQIKLDLAPQNATQEALTNLSHHLQQRDVGAVSLSGTQVTLVLDVGEKFSVLGDLLEVIRQSYPNEPPLPDSILQVISARMQDDCPSLVLANAKLTYQQGRNQLKNEYLQPALKYMEAAEQHYKDKGKVLKDFFNYLILEANDLCALAEVVEYVLVSTVEWGSELNIELARLLFSHTDPEQLEPETIEHHLLRALQCALKAKHTEDGFKLVKEIVDSLAGVKIMRESLGLAGTTEAEIIAFLAKRIREGQRKIVQQDEKILQLEQSLAARGLVGEKQRARMSQVIKEQHGGEQKIEELEEKMETLIREISDLQEPGSALK